MSEEEKTGRLSRWAARKQAVQKGELEIDAVEGIDADVDEIALAAEKDEKQQALEANRMAAEAVDLENIDEETDFKLFLKEGVPALLKKKALAVLWRSNPILANVDGLNDYDENFADPKYIMKNFDSAYKIGKGYLKKIVEDIEELAESIDGDAPSIEAILADEKPTQEHPDETPDEAPDESKEPEQIFDAKQAEEDDDEVFEEDAPKLSLRQRRQLMGEF